MRYSRFLAALTATVLFVVYAGCGGEDKKESRATGSGGQVPSAGARPAGQGAMADSAVAPEYFTGIVVNLRQIVQSPVVAEVLKEETVAAAIKKFGIDPSEVEQLVVLLGVDEKQPGQKEPFSVIIARFAHDVDAKVVLTKLQAAEAASGPVPIQEVQVAGKTCLDLGEGNAPMAYVPSKNTIILTSKANMGRVVSSAGPKGSLWERLQKAPADNDVIVALEPGAFPNFDQYLDTSKKDSPLDLSPAKKLRGGTATFSLSAPVMLHVALDVKDAEAAGDVEEWLQQAVSVARGGLLLAKRGIPQEMQVTLGPLLKLADEFVAGAKTAKSGNQVTLDVKRPEILETAGPSIIGAVRQYVTEARAAERRVRETYSLHLIGIAMLNYSAANGGFPPAAIEKDGKPLLSWRVAILPYMEFNTAHKALYKQFHLDEPWDSPHNLEVAKFMPLVYQSPGIPSDGKTRVMLFTGKGAAFDGGKLVRAADIRDGTSNTILCVEAGPDKAVPWTKPEDLPFEPQNPLATLGAVSPQGFLAVFFDGHVGQLKVDNPTLKALITPDGGEPIDQTKLYGER